MITPAALVQQQMDAYNAHDVDALLATYAPDARLYEHPATLLAEGAAQIRARMAVRLAEPGLRAELVNRIVAGDTVIDHEYVLRHIDGAAKRLELVAIYQVKDGRIAQAWFISGAITPVDAQ
ncbi:MAG TPA: nuclear transport factor 2 family protein [Burkholderiaceae bacterium]